MKRLTNLLTVGLVVRNGVLFGLATGLASSTHAQFSNVSISAGIVVFPDPTPEGNPPSGIDPYSSGSPACAADVDGDGWTDLLLSPTPGRVNLFMNLRNGRFSEQGAARGLGGAIDIGGICAGDFSNSGKVDLFMVPRSGARYLLFSNNGSGVFSEVAVERNADLLVSGQPHQGQSVGLVDFDRDGFIDIHVAEWGFGPSSGGDRYAVLLRNRGRERAGFFENSTQTSGLTQPHFTSRMGGFASAWADFDEDGYPDLSLVSDFTTSQMWWNLGNGTFREERDLSGVGLDRNGMGVAVADFDRDGLLDFFVSSFGIEAGVAVSENHLYRNVGERRFRNVASEAGVVNSSFGWGAAFLDSENRGVLDLIVTNGFYYNFPPSNPPHENALGDTRSDRTSFFRNSGNGFVENGIDSGIVDTGQGRSVVVLDYDNDGDEDIFITNTYAQPILYRNDNPSPQNHWLRLKFQGTSSNRDGYGALVRVRTGTVTQTGLYQPTNAYIGQREPVLHFGLGAASVADSVIVTWPSGTVQDLGPIAGDQVITVVEPIATNFIAPAFTSVSAGGALEKDSSVTLSVTVTGEPHPTLTWYKNGTPIAGAVGPELRFKVLHPSDAGTYTVVASNAAGTATSSAMVVSVTANMADQTVARWWNEALLDAIRRDTPNPPIHGRNLYHLSATLWDAFWTCQPEGWTVAEPIFHREDLGSETFGGDREAAQREVMSYAAYRLLSARFATGPGAVATRAANRWLMNQLGYDPDFSGTTGNSPAAVGNRIGTAILAATINDGANEANGYADATGYVAVNEPLVVGVGGNTMLNPNRWQPLSLKYSVTQNGIILPSGPQTFVGVNARLTTPFALAKPTPTTIAIDPGPPPQFGGAEHERVVDEILDVLYFSSLLDPLDPTRVDISPAASLNNPLGTNAGTGRAINPFTGAPYATNSVRRADYARVLAEYWADGPRSETPPGHWNVIFNQVSDDPRVPHRYGGVGPVLPRLEWDVRGYLALNGALHDAACAAWTVKRQYDGVRPISLIRHMAGLGQSSDPAKPRYHANGLPLVPGLIELTTLATVGIGGPHEEIVPPRADPALYVDRLVVRAWRGVPANPRTQIGGVGWILADKWTPYQMDTFVTPAFPGYISGHSTFSRTAAEVMTLLTGSPFFPGGFSSYLFRQNQYLTFELGPTEDFSLQWATYYDAADQAGLSRLFGGIHMSADDLTGRRLGARIGLDGFLRAHTQRSARLGRESLINVSTRGPCGTGERVLIGGFVVGDGPEQDILLRAVGPTLENFGIPADLCSPNPSLEVYPQGSSVPTLLNDNWGLSPRAADIASIGAQRFAFELPSGSPDAAELLTVSSGIYTFITRSGDDSRLPVQLAEAYGQRLRNVSTRGYVGSGFSVLIAGFVLDGTEPASVLIRGVGPKLADYGVQQPLPDPVITLYRMRPGQEAQVLATNDNWSTDVRASLAEVGGAEVGAFALPSGSKDAAMFMQLEPGIYTVIMESADGADGVGLVEAYHIR